MLRYVLTASSYGARVAGLDLAIGYDELATIPAHKFERKRVMILGCGNAAFETADALRDHVSSFTVHRDSYVARRYNQKSFDHSTAAPCVHRLPILQWYAVEIVKYCRKRGMSY